MPTVHTPTTGVLLINLGTPNSYRVPDVRTYLRQFLLDPRVIDINPIVRYLLVNGIIAPFRAPKSAKVYKQLWTEQGSPLLVYGKALTQLVQEQLGPDYKVVLGMRYQNPSIASTIEQVWNSGIQKLVVFPLFPQYASASTGSVIEEVQRIISTKQIIPELHFISNYFDHPLFIKAFVSLAQQYLSQNSYDHILFSYHGLPERQIRKGDCTNTCLKSNTCCNTLHAMNRYCYRAQCFETTRLIASQLGLTPNSYSTAFQSRLGNDPWIKPFTDDVIKNLAHSNVKRVLTLVPSFVADCLETTIEVGEEYKELFLHEGGTHWQMVESLNTNPIWVQMVSEMVRKAAN